MVDPVLLAQAQQTLTDRPDKDPDGWMDQCANYLVVNMDIRLVPQAIPIIAQLRSDGWLEHQVDTTLDRIVG